MKTENITNGSEPTTLPIETVEELKSRLYANFLNGNANIYQIMDTCINWQKQQDEKRYNTLLESHKELLEALGKAKNRIVMYLRADAARWSNDAQKILDFSNNDGFVKEINALLISDKQIQP